MVEATYVAVPGTHALEGPGEWWWPGSLWERAMRSYGLYQANPLYPVAWSRDLDGVPWEGERKYADWKAGARLMGMVYDSVTGHPAPPLVPETRPLRVQTSYAEGLNVIAHSYGLYVALMTAATGRRIRVLISVGSPIRGDMGPWVARALPHIGYWLHVYDRRWDGIAHLGQLFDRLVSWKRTAVWKVAGQTIGAHQQAATNGISHSRLFTDPGCFPLWESQGFIGLLREGCPPVNTTSTPGGDVGHGAACRDTGGDGPRPEIPAESVEIGPKDD